MLSLSALSSSMIRSAVSRMASWEAKRGSWGHEDLRGGVVEAKQQKAGR